MKQPPYTAVFKESCTLGNVMHYVPGDVAMLSSFLCKEVLSKKFAEIYTADDIFRRYQPGDDNIFVHLPGGLGDVIAFSAVSLYLKDFKIQVYINPAMFGLVQQFTSRNLFPKPYYSSIINNVKKARGLSRIPMEFVGVQSGTKNWYHEYFKRIGVTNPEPLNCRPDMFTIIQTIKNTILISHRASCQMRSSRFEDFYIPIKKVYPCKMFFVHEKDLTFEDRQFIDENAPGVKILKQCSIDEYLITLASMELVISTDTAAIHYREAIKKPCLAVYGAFTVESRTEFYQYTSSFNVKSDCPFKPCFIHELTKGVICQKSEQINGCEKTAPCQTGIEFQKQLEWELLKYIY